MMKAAVLKAFGQPLVIEERPIPQPGPGEALVQIKASGLCASDLHIQDGMIPSVRLPLVPGHEMAGVVMALGRDTVGPRPGAHVVCAIDILCGQCRFCRTGRGNLCTGLVRIGFERDGSHEEYAVVPAGNLFPIDAGVPFAQAAVIPDAVACMYHALRTQGRVTAGDRVLILGVGGLGLQAVQLARYLGAEVYVTSRQEEKLRIAAALGADAGINTRRQDLYETVRTLTGNEMCDVVFDNIGSPDSVMDSLRVLRPGGRVVVAGYAAAEFTVNYQALVIKEKEIVGIRGSTREDLAESIRLVERGAVRPYIHKTYPLEDINLALQDLREGKNLGRTALQF